MADDDVSPQDSWMGQVLGLQTASYAPPPESNACTTSDAAPAAPAEMTVDPNVSIEPSFAGPNQTPDPRNASAGPAPEPETSLAAAPAPPPPEPAAPAASPPTPMLASPDDLYKKGYQDGRSGGMAVCPADVSAEGEAAYESGLANGRRDKAAADAPPPPSVRTLRPDQMVKTRVIMVLSDDKVGLVKKVFTGTDAELDQIEARASADINQQQMENFSSLGETPTGAPRAPPLKGQR